MHWNKHGKNAEDLIVNVPPGTVVFEGEKKMLDLEEGEQIVARGGRGGYGNAHFISSRRQAPKVAELGEPGEEKRLILELKLIADVGLVGLPNAGKSTLLSVVSNARPKIADYPFTTLIPNLGVVDGSDFSFVVCDIPGLIEGASLGKGLGTEFLRHIERNKLIVHLIDSEAADPVASYNQINKELKSYSKELAEKTQILVLTKTDVVSENEVKKMQAKLKKETGKEVYAISAASHKNLDVLVSAIQNSLEKIRKQPAKVKGEKTVITLEDAPARFRIDQDKNGFMLSGEEIERFAVMSDFKNEHTRARFYDIMRKKGITRRLLAEGAREGDSIKVAGKTLEFIP